MKKKLILFCVCGIVRVLLMVQNCRYTFNILQELNFPENDMAYY